MGYLSASGDGGGRGEAGTLPSMGMDRCCTLCLDQSELENIPLEPQLYVTFCNIKYYFNNVL